MQKGSLLEIHSPEDLYKRENFRPSLDFHPKTERRLADVLSEYHFPKTLEIPCGIGSCHTKHQRGYLVTTSDGLETNIGNRCGRIHLGADFVSKRNAFKEERIKLSNITAINEIRAAITPFTARVNELKPKASRIFQLKKQITTQLPSLAKILTNRAKNKDRDIFKYVEMSKDEAKADYFKSETELEFDKWFKQKRPKKRALFGRLDGLNIFILDLHKTLQLNIISYIEKIQKLDEEKIAALKQKELHELASWASKRDLLLEDARKLIQQGESFFTKENVRLLAELDMELRADENPHLSRLVQQLLLALS